MQVAIFVFKKDSPNIYGSPKKRAPRLIYSM